MAVINVYATKRLRLTGLMYFKGKGVAVDKVAGMKWFILADDYDDAVTYRRYAESKMSREEIEEAKVQAAKVQ